MQQLLVSWIMVGEAEGISPQAFHIPMSDSLPYWDFAIL